MYSIFVRKDKQLAEDCKNVEKLISSIKAEPRVDIRFIARVPMSRVEEFVKYCENFFKT